MISENSRANLLRLAEAGRLKAESASSAELANLLANASDALTDARNTALSLAALRARDFRPGRGDGHRALVFQLLPHTVNASPELWVPLDKAHRKRNDLEYNAIATFSKSETASLIAQIAVLDNAVREMLAEERPDLVAG